MRARHLLAVVVAGALLAPVAAADAASGPDRGQFSITPARRTVTGRPPAALVPTVVGNTTRRDYAVEVFPVLLRPTVAGPFVFSERPAPLRAAANVLTVSPRRFVLRAGTRRTVRLRWNVMPEGRRSIAVGVVFQGTPSAQAGQTLRTISRLLSLNFLQDPRARPARGEGVSLAARPDPGRARHLLLVPRVRNRGGRVATPGCRPSLRVRDARGRVVRRVRWRGDVVVPGAEREFAVPLPGVLPAGRYTAAARACLGRTRVVRVTGRFHLVGDGVLPAPALTLRAFNAAGEPDEEARARGTFTSTGTAPASSTVVVRLFRRKGAVPEPRPMRVRRVRIGPLAPGRRAALDVGLGTLPPGEYRATATYRQRAGSVQTETSDFAPVAQRSRLDRAWRWVKDHAGWLVAAVLALLLLLTRRRRRDDR